MATHSDSVHHALLLGKLVLENRIESGGTFEIIAVF